MVNIAVFVSGSGTNLGALIEAQKNGIIKSGKISLVLSSKEGVFALERAKNAGIEWLVLKRRDFCSQKEYDDALLKILADRNIDMIVLAGFLSILSGEIVRKYDKRIINVHPSLIPAFSGKGFYGLKVHEAALERGVKLSGATVHYVNEIADGGEIIYQKAVAVTEDDTPISLQRKIMQNCEWVLLPMATEKVARDILRKKSR